MTTKKVYLVPIFLMALLMIRFMDFTLFYNFVKKDLEETPGLMKKNFHYAFIGFSSFNNAEKTLMRIMNKTSEGGAIIGYYDLIHPVVFLVYNKTDTKMEPILWELRFNAIQKGLTEIYSYKFEFSKVVHQGKSEFYMTCILGTPFSSYGNRELKNDSDLAGYTHALIHSPCFGLNIMKKLKDIYIYYFYAPFIIILLLHFIFGRSILLSFLYFGEMVLLFPVKYFALYPLERLLSLLGFQGDSIPGLCFMSLLLITVIILIIMGFREKKKVRLKPVIKFIILFFLLLPILLRF